MDILKPKKLALIRILQILQRETDCDHPLTHNEITHKLQEEYGIVIERKAVARNISLLKEAKYKIETTKKGSYLDNSDSSDSSDSRLFEDSELRLLCDSVLASRHITAKHSKDLIDKLTSLAGEHFKSRLNNVYAVDEWNKTEHPSLFYNIEIVDEAIETNRRIQFNYSWFDANGKFTHTKQHAVSPYRMIMHNQHYYVVTYEERHKDINNFHLDRISDIVVLDEPSTDIKTVLGFEKGIDYKKLSLSPYLFADKPQSITLEITDEWMINQIIDCFGNDFKTFKQNGKTRVVIKASPKAMVYWAMQYLDHVEILYPLSLRQRIAENIRLANEKYSKTVND